VTQWGLTVMPLSGLTQGELRHNVSIGRNMCLPGLDKTRKVLKICWQNGFLWPISASRDLDLWPSDLQSFTSLSRWLLAPIYIKIVSFIYKISYSQVW